MREDRGQARPTTIAPPGAWRGDSASATVSAFLWAEIVAVALTAALLYSGSSATARTPVKDAVGWDTLRIDGNRAKQVVLFPHTKHQETIGKEREACQTCHHMSKPNDGPTRCYVCHRDMYESRSIFEHASHREALGGNASCNVCHPEGKARELAKPCQDCHKKYTKALDDYMARSYESAMHSRCIGCHREKDKKRKSPVLSKCDCCHPDMDDRG